MIDEKLDRGGIQAQKTGEPKSPDAPDNLFQPVQGYDTIEGDFSDRAHPRSYYTWLETHPNVKRAALAGAVLGTVALLRRRGDGDAGPEQSLPQPSSEMAQLRDGTLDQTGVTTPSVGEITTPTAP